MEKVKTNTDIFIKSYNCFPPPYIIHASNGMFIMLIKRNGVIEKLISKNITYTCIAVIQDVIDITGDVYCVEFNKND